MTKREVHPDIRRAQHILRGVAASPEEMYALAQRLKDNLQAFTYARRLLGRLRRTNATVPGVSRRTLTQQHALCTYKDPDLAAHTRFRRALAILSDEEDLTTTTDQETLGLAGAIYKRWWEFNGQREYLERALACYRRGYVQGVARDYGYTAINTAFVLDLLAAQEEAQADRVGASEVAARGRRDEAQSIRREIVETLPQLEERENNLGHRWWYLVTIAEAYYGLRRYDEARRWLERAASLPEDRVKPWEFEATARQLAALARLHGVTADPDASEAGEVLREFLGGDTEAVLSSFLGKVGLALSGGGFRASLFHIGVLAKLAELDMLRHVSVLSCVSGGSIVGAHYYLEVRRLLHEKRDDDITRDHYVEIVQRIADRFLSGVQQNLRMQIFGEIRTNLKTLVDATYTHTQRLGELYESVLYAAVDDGEGDKPRRMDGLFVYPVGTGDDFVPKYDNWRRRAKVPILVLNATTLNTGHNWQFTASWMGESPAAVDEEIDGNYRLRRLYYHQAPPEHEGLRLGSAVAASSAVPVIFDPLTLDGLYPDVTVQLVDGGVHDNQGIVGLLEQDCTVLLVSDASGQMESHDRPSVGLTYPPLRSGNILGARVRAAQYQDLAARRRSSLLRGLTFVHLKKSLAMDPKDWVDSQDPYQASDEARPPEERGSLTPYGIPRKIQEALAAIRTDLDAFSDVEAYALMTSGYRMTEHEFARTIDGFPEPSGDPPEWPFLAIEEEWFDPVKQERILRVLNVGSDVWFKAWKLSRGLRIVTILLLTVLVLAALYAGVRWFGGITPLVEAVLVIVIVAPVLIVGAAALVAHSGWTKRSTGRLLFSLFLLVAGWAVAAVQLNVLDKIYLREGRFPRNTDRGGTRA